MSDSNPVPKAAKRKAQRKTSFSRKKVKVQHRSADDLPWKTVSRPQEAGLGGDDGILEFEEIEGVEVVYEETEGGKVARFNVSCRAMHGDRCPMVSLGSNTRRGIAKRIR